MPPKVAGQTYCLQKLERATTTVDVPKTLLKCQSLSDKGSLGADGGVSDSGATIGVWTTNRPTTKTVTSCTNPYTAKYQRRQAMLMAMRPVEVIAMLRDLNLTSHAFSVNAQELQSRISRYAEIGNSQPFNPDVGDPFVMELSRLLANTLASAKSLISGQRTRACR